MSGHGPGTTVLIGVGNPDRRDDGVGLEVVRRLRGRVPGSVIVLETTGEATALMAAWAGAHRAVVVDATSSGTAPGRIQRFRADGGPLPANALRRSSHDFGLAEAIELSRRLGTLPRRLLVYGIEGSDFGHGRGLTPPVADAVEALARHMQGELLTATSVWRGPASAGAVVRQPANSSRSP